MTIKKLSYKDGVKAGLPIALGYFPIAMAFGLLSKSTNIGLKEAAAFSGIVFAGASQFVAIGMIGNSATVMQIILVTLFLNFRHFLLSASIATKLEINILKPVISFFITDESFATASFADGELTAKYMLPMEIIPYLGWFIGTITGYIIGDFLPPLLQHSMGLGLYAMFISLLMPEIKKDSRAIVLIFMSGIINTILRFAFNISQGVSIVFSIVIVSFLGVLIFSDEEKDNDDTNIEMEAFEYE